ncbi:RelA/SpoT family protein [Methylovulum psychrotolerans]|uniref:GTP pyrophosphokinase n=1 Tax=Methylovulum psychrotolerans TaxID=1704499 RepID=A0A1Z4BYF8_9GAMM|nr:bifunctional (p)ppGpp synthetase/guanosine-3',5'-bis(diphosphate) 3'-pyrophosphohydrolase [Methylovulum psychrotolerans]ASF46291.1 GTP diphosphokinase [Methylovulum psychrotolerans]POZ51237.1 bifunctional (p)ppGpp synthetase/guanosine-3',5'-bis(diphosphate) 3'-pyrophosphohydrolase [Methylovulum psychrotolerans]
MKKNINTDKLIFSNFSEPDRLQIDKALAIVGQLADDPRYYRPKGIEVATILMDFNVDLSTILAAILSDPRLTALKLLPQIKAQFGETVAALVQDVNWLNTIAIYSLDMTDQPSQSEILRRMLLSMTQDVRAVLIKLAYRIKRLGVLPKESYEMRRFIAQETLDIYAPIANRMGIHQLKWELEDMAFRYLKPQSYLHIAKSLNDNRIGRENCIGRFIETLKTTLGNEGISASIYGRPKHIYSIWKKMQRKQLGIEELYDLLAVRVIVDNLTACYTTLGIVHSLWQTIPKEFDDYIANPKENGYQSLHTVIIDPDGRRIEVQIRTQEMHDFAEFGVAAHWSYKEGGKHDAAVEKSISSLRKLLEEKDDDETLSEHFRNELFHDRVYVLTPKGKLIDLVKNSTPLDFAYAIHSEIGHRCRGAKVNGRIVPLTYLLKSGEQVEILTTKEGGPNRNWIDPNLGYLKSANAISKVKSWFKNQQEAQNIAAGKAILDKESQRLGIKTPNLNELAKHFHQPDTEQLLEFIGRGDINTRQLAAFFKIPELEAAKTKTPPANAAKAAGQSAISVDGLHQVLTTLARCCTPVPGDDIIGFISLKKGIIVHNKQCVNILELNHDKQSRLIGVAWGEQTNSYFVPIIVKAYSTRNLLNEVSQLLAEEKINISNAAMDTHPDGYALLKMTIQIKNTDQLSRILRKIGCLANVIDVKRNI